MGRPGLEVFKFGVYLFIPIAAMYYFNRPDLGGREIKDASLYRDTAPGERPPASYEANEEALRRLRARHQPAGDGPSSASSRV